MLYEFKAKRSNGEVYEGSREAKDKFTIYKELKEEGNDVISVHEKGESKSIIGWLQSVQIFARVKMHDRIIFARNLGAMIDAGLPVSRALSVMERQAKNQKLKKILASLNSDISSGKTLSDGMKLFPDTFSSLFISMVKAGEQSGSLSQSLKVVANQMDKSYSLQKKVKGAMMYPSIILIAMVIIAILMLTFIVPTLTTTFKELQVELPLSTQLIIGISDLIRNHGLLVLAGIVVAGLALYMAAKKPKGKRALHYSILKIPIIGAIVKEINAARTSRTLSSLLYAGVDVVEAIKITGEVIQNVFYKEVLAKAGEAIEKGAPISQVFLEREDLYPVFVGEMISVGEETGKVGDMLLGVATFYEDEVEQKTKDMSTIIEPFLMIVIGSAVGFFALAMMSPTYSLMSSL